MWSRLSKLELVAICGGTSWICQNAKGRCCILHNWGLVTWRWSMFVDVRVSIMMPSFFRTFLPAEFIVLLPVGPCSYTSINSQFESSLPVSVGLSWALYALFIYSRLIIFNSNHRHLFLWLVDQENPHFAILHYCTPFTSIQQWLWRATVSPTIKDNFKIAFFLSYNIAPISKSSL